MLHHNNKFSESGVTLRLDKTSILPDINASIKLQKLKLFAKRLKKEKNISYNLSLPYVTGFHEMKYVKPSRSILGAAIKYGIVSNVQHDDTWSSLALREFGLLGKEALYYAFSGSKESTISMIESLLSEYDKK